MVRLNPALEAAVIAAVRPLDLAGTQRLMNQPMRGAARRVRALPALHPFVDQPCLRCSTRHHPVTTRACRLEAPLEHDGLHACAQLPREMQL